MKKSLKIPKW